MNFTTLHRTTRPPQLGFGCSCGSRSRAMHPPWAIAVGLCHIWGLMIRSTVPYLQCFAPGILYFDHLLGCSAGNVIPKSAVHPCRLWYH